MLIVQKYGGSSVATPERVFNVANQIAEAYKQNNDVVVVLSAQGNMTNELIEKANQIDINAPKRELDMLLATGEQQSIALMAIALNSLGLPAVSLNAQQVGITSTADHGNAKIIDIDINKIMLEIKKRNIVIIAGFQGINQFGDITTLGRGASDTTAIALAAVLNADFCEIYTDVDGIYTADPRLIKTALKHEEISYDEMLEFASMGANVLHNRSVELAKKYDIPFTVKSSLSKKRETLITNRSGLEEKTVSGVTADRNVCRISVVSLESGSAAKILFLLSKYRIRADVITQTMNADNTENISFSVSKTDGNKVIELLEDVEGLNPGNICQERHLAKLSVIGTGIAYDPGISAMLYEILQEEGIKIYQVSTSEIKVSVLLEDSIINHALSVVHDRFTRASILRPISNHKNVEII